MWISHRLIYRLIWLGSAFAIVALLAFFITKPPADAQLGPMTPFQTSDRSISLERPSNWIGGVTSTAGGSVSIRFQGGLASSLVVSEADVLPGAAAALMGSPSPPELLKSLHQQDGQRMAASDLYPGYNEQSTTPALIDGAPALVTRFNYLWANNDGLVLMSGERATALKGSRGLRVVAHCPEVAAYAVLPVVNRILQSIKLGEEPGGD